MQKVFGVGFSKTGTTSLEKAFTKLGYKAWNGHWKNPNNSFAMALYLYKDYDEIFKIVNLYDAFSDAPWGGSNLYIELFKRLPESKFVLTVRDAETWYRSFERMITKFDENLETAFDSFYAQGRYGTVYYFKKIFDIETMVGNKNKIIEHYNTYNQNVIRFFTENKADFLVFDMERGDEWKKLCKFLDKSVPSIPFPDANKSTRKSTQINAAKKKRVADNSKKNIKKSNDVEGRQLVRRVKRYIGLPRDFIQVRRSGLFNQTWYLENNPDVVQAKANPLLHYLQHGGFEGRDPGPGFSSKWYLDTYADVKEAGVNPLIHYLRFGRKEGRLAKPAFLAATSKTTLTKPYEKRERDFFFIVGTGRSGTTLMAQIMNANSKVCVPGELQIVFEYSNNGARLAEIFSSRGNLSLQAEDYIKLVQQRCPHDLQAYYDYHAFFQQRDYPIMSLKELLTELYSDIAHSQGKTMFAEQTPWYGQNIELLDELFSGAKFIHMVRDGRDVAISYARTPWWHNDVDLNLERWEKEVNKIENDGTLLLDGRLLTIRYEDLVLAPVETVTNICSFLGVPFEETMLDPNYHVDYSQFSKHPNDKKITSSAYQDWQRQKKSAFFTDSVYGWKTNAEFSFDHIEAPVKQTLSRFGYDV